MAKKTEPSQHAKQSKVEDVAQAELPTRYGRFTIHGFRGAGAEDEAVALVRGKIRGPFKSIASPVVGMARTRTGKGYWIITSAGGVFNFGDARFFGGLGHLNGARGAAVGMAPAVGGGYWIASQR